MDALEFWRSLNERQQKNVVNPSGTILLPVAQHDKRHLWQRHDLMSCYDDLALPVCSHPPASQHRLADCQLGTIPVEHRAAPQHLIVTRFIDNYITGVLTGLIDRGVGFTTSFTLMSSPADALRRGCFCQPKTVWRANIFFASQSGA